MERAVIIDIVILAVLGLFVLAGIRRGLLRSLAGLLSVVLALAGAWIIAAGLTGPAAELLSPIVEQHLEERVQQAAESLPPENAAPESAAGLRRIEELLSRAGVDSGAVDAMAERAAETVRAAGVSIAVAVLNAMAYSVIHALVFGLAFAVLLAALRLLTRTLDLVLKLPGLHFLNTAGGAVAGAVEGAVVVVLAMWLAQCLGYPVEQMTAGSRLIGLLTACGLNAVPFWQ